MGRFSGFQSVRVAFWSISDGLQLAQCAVMTGIHKGWSALIFFLSSASVRLFAGRSAMNDWNENQT